MVGPVSHSAVLPLTETPAVRQHSRRAAVLLPHPVVVVVRPMGRQELPGQPRLLSALPQQFSPGLLAGPVQATLLVVRAAVTQRIIVLPVVVVAAREPAMPVVTVVPVQVSPVARAARARPAAGLAPLVVHRPAQERATAALVVAAAAVAPGPVSVVTAARLVPTARVVAARATSTPVLAAKAAAAGPVVLDTSNWNLYKNHNGKGHSMNAELEAIRDTLDKQTGDGRDYDGAVDLADAYIAANPEQFTEFAEDDIEDSVKALEAYRNAGRDELEWRAQTWILHKWHPQQIGGTVQPSIRDEAVTPVPNARPKVRTTVKD